MSTPTNIVNIALRRIGSSRISDLETDNYKEAVVARDLYSHNRRFLLNTHTWWFATRRSQLTESATAPTFGWDNAFILPDDFIRVASVHPYDNDQSFTEYRLGNQSSDERVLETNSTSAYLRYVFDLQDVAVMSSAFQQAFALLMAKDLGSALSKPVTHIDRIEDEYKKALSRAKSAEGVEDYAELLGVGLWATTREPDTSWG